MRAGSPEALAGQKFAVPGTYSLSGRIIHQWLAGGGSGAAAGSSNLSNEAGESQGGGGGAVGSAAAARGGSLDAVADVQIDEGVFKYVLLRVTDLGGSTKVRLMDY